jgi:hypothetical protein
MRTEILVVIIFTLSALIHAPGEVSAQQRQSKCSQIRYTAPHLNLKSFRLNRIEGQAVYASPSQKWELGSGNGVCVTFFNRKNRELVATVTTDDKGQFEFINIAPGDYVLIAFAGDLQKISLPLQVIPAAKAKKPARLLLHLRDKEDKRHSYVTRVTNPAR